MGRENSVCTVNSYGMHGPGIEIQWQQDIPQPSRPTLGPTQPPVTWVPGLFPGSQAAEEWR
jgi:hypothetical protein